MTTRLPFFAILCFSIALPPAHAQLLFTNFGADVEVYGHEVLVGEPHSRYRPGIVYVFTKNEEGNWTEHRQLTAPDPLNYDGFGNSIAVSGDRLLVGAVRQNEGLGSAFLFEHRHGEGWIETAQLSVADVDAEDGFAAGVALEDDLAVVGAPGRIAFGPPGHPRRPGAAYVFRRDGATWRQVAKLTAGAAPEAAAFGHQVAISDGRVVVGAPGHNQQTGAVYVFEERDGSWTEVAQLTGSGTQHGAEFGAAVAAHGNELYVGAPGFDAGAVFAYTYDSEGKRWAQSRIFRPFDGPQSAAYGSSIGVDRSGSLWIGAPGARQMRGVVYQIARHPESGDWHSASIITPDDHRPMDFFAGSVAVAGDIAAVASLGADGMTGTASVFERDGDSTWRHAGVVRSAPVSLPRVTGERRTCSDGEAEIFACSNVDLLSFLPVEDLGGERGIWVNDLWGWTDSETGKEYVLIGRTNGTSFVDISDPSNPVYLGQLPKTEGSNDAVWRDVKVYADHAYIVADYAGPHGVQVFDLTQLRHVTDAPMTFEMTARYEGIHSAHNIVINTETGFAYSVGNSGGGETCGGGLHMINIQDPANPAFAGCFSHAGTGMQGTGYTHDAQCVTYRGPDADYSGREICFSANETALSIGDVTDKENVVYISTGTYPNSAYVHQGWLTVDHRYFYVNDEGDEVAGLVDQTRTLIWDVSDLDDPQLVQEYMWGERASDHNLYIHGDLMYQSNYVSGLRIHDISDPENPREVGFFDTVPAGDNGPGFAGSWSNYPYFESGTIAVSSMGEGLFLVRKQMEPGL